MATAKKTTQKKASPKASPKNAPAKKQAAKKSAPKAKEPNKAKAPKKVVDVIDDFVDRDALAVLAKKVDDVVNQEKIQPAVEQAKVVVSGVAAEAEKKISWLKKLFGKKTK
jgi:hypothetical protein